MPSAAQWCGLCFTGMGGAAVLTAPAPVVAVPAAPPVATSDGRMLGGRALLLVCIAIAVGAVGMGVSWALGRDEQLEPETYIRYAIVLTVAVYAVVGALVVTQLAPAVRLRWSRGVPATGILVGAAVGGGLGALLLAGVSAQAGHLSPDPRVLLMMSEGDAPHILVTILLTCVCAPLVEEVLFRGLLLESLRDRRAGVAIAVSGLAFAVWHLNPAALRYYALMGALLGWLYIKRGLVCSMAGHAAFNGVLTVAALAIVLSPGTTVAAGDISLVTPGGWSVMHRSGSGMELQGPSGSALLVVAMPSASAPSAATVVQRLRAGALGAALPGLVVHTESTRELRLPAGDAVEVDLEADGHSGTMVFLPLTGRTVNMVFLSGGSRTAEADFPKLVDSLRVG